MQLGERGSNTKSRPVQDFEELRSQCLENGELFEDPTFTADSSSISYSKKKGREFEWLRPTVRFSI